MIILLFCANTANASLRKNYFNLSPEEFANIPIYSVSKQEENSFQTAASTYVITDEDIRRSGATSIVEALRLAPGVQVVRADSSRHLVSVRGFNETFTNKLLVLVDGRSVYTPLFAGVYWDELDYILEDISRIEIIKGSGGTLWGTNAVNGIINIITKTSIETQGNLIETTVGSADKVISSARRGGKIGHNLYFKGYAKFVERKEVQKLNSGEGLNDRWDRTQAGFRIDNDSNNNLAIQGNVYKVNKDGTFQLPAASPSTVNVENDKEEISGGNILFNWTNKLSDISQIKLQGYFDYVRRDHIILDQEIYKTDLEFQHISRVNPRHEIISGFGARIISYDLEGTNILSFEYPDSSENIYNAFIQDKISLIDKKLYLTIGSKIEYNEYTNAEYLPNIRLAWLVSKNQTLWSAISKAVRMPSKAETDLSFALQSNGSKFYRWVGNPDYESEEMVSYEVGYRIKSERLFSVDTSLFYNEYKNLKTYESGDNLSDTFSADYFYNNGKGDIYGGEVSLDWKIKDNWQLIASYTHLKMMLNTTNGSTDSFLEQDEGESPRNMYNIRSHYNIFNNLEVDNIIYYMDDLPDVSTGIRSYIRFDTRIGYSLNKGRIKLSLVGQNLFDDKHQEGKGSVPGNGASDIGRMIYGKISLRF